METDHVPKTIEAKSEWDVYGLQVMDMPSTDNRVILELCLRIEYPGGSAPCPIDRIAVFDEARDIFKDFEITDIDQEKVYAWFQPDKPTAITKRTFQFLGEMKEDA